MRQDLNFHQLPTNHFREDKIVHHIVDDNESLQKMAEVLGRSAVIAIDTETTGLSTTHDKLVGYCLAGDAAPMDGWYVPVGHTLLGPGEKQLEQCQVQPIIKEVITDKFIVMHNASFDINILRRYGFEDIECDFDTIIAARLLGYPMSASGMKVLSDILYGYEQRKLETLFDSKKDINFSKLSITNAYKYAADDGIVTLALWRSFKGVISSDYAAVMKIEMGAVPITCEMERTGWCVDIDMINNTYSTIQAMLEESATYWYMQLVSVLGLAENPFTIDESGAVVSVDNRKLFLFQAQMGRVKKLYTFTSPTKLKKLIFDVLRYKPTLYTKKQEPMTGIDALKLMEDKAGIIPNLIFLQKTNTLLSTYDQIIKHAKQDEKGNWRVYTRFNQLGADTGRFSSRNPNLQNIGNVIKADLHLVEGLPLFRQAKRDLGRVSKYATHKLNEFLWTYDPTDKKYSINFAPREAFIATPGWTIIHADYSQQELRITFGISGEKAGLHAYAQGIDIHRLSASLFLGKPYSEITSSDRTAAKALNFGIIYGMIAETLWNNLGRMFTLRQCEVLYNSYFKAYPNVAKMYSDLASLAKRRMYSQTYFGRRRLMFNIMNPESLNWRFSSRQERQAVNSVIQGTAADITKIASMRLGEELHKAWGDNARVISTLHDAFYFEIKDTIDPKEFAEWLTPIMTIIIAGFPPFVVEIEQGKSWSAIKYGEIEYNDPFKKKFDTFEEQQKYILNIAEKAFGVEDIVTTDTNRQASTYRFNIDSLTQRDLARVAVLIQSRPGDNTFIFVKGSDILELPVKTSLTDKHPEIRALLGEALEDNEELLNSVISVI